MIVLNRVTKFFDGKRVVTALYPFDLAIAKGEMDAVVGPSGSDKSTLVNLIAGLDNQASAGSISIDGECSSGVSDETITRIGRDKIDSALQFFNLLPSLNTIENVSIPLHLRGWPRGKVRERSAELLKLVGARKADRTPARRTLWRRTPANCHGPRSCGLPADSPGRRAHGQPGFFHGGQNHTPHSRASRPPWQDPSDRQTRHGGRQRVARTIALRDGRIVSDLRR